MPSIPTVTIFMNYHMWFSDPAVYAAAVAAANGTNFLEMAPRTAAASFGIPYPYPIGSINSTPTGIEFDSTFYPGAEIRMPQPTGFFVDDTVLSFTMPGQPGVPASIFPISHNYLFIWSGLISLNQGAGESGSPPTFTIAQRRWQIGFEEANILEGANYSQTALSRDFSRVPDGKGFGIRGQNFTFLNMPINTFRTALTSKVSWERLYIRFRRAPTNEIMMYRAHGNSGQSAFQVNLTTAGTIKGYNINNGGASFDKGVILTPVANQWYRLDILIKFDTGVGTSGKFIVYVDGTQVFTFTDSTSEGMNQSSLHISTDLGTAASADQSAEMDFDDWINSDLPSNMDVTALTFNSSDRPADWLLGSHVRAVNSVSASLTNWTPNSFGNLNQGINPLRGTDGQLVSTTSGATMEGVTDALPQSVQYGAGEINLGVVSANIGLNSSNSGGTDGTLGYRIAGGGAVLATINQLNTFQPRAVAYQPTGMDLPDEVSPLSLVHVKSADGNTDTVRAMSGTVELLGVWGPEDDPLYNPGLNRLTNIHNANYLNTPWGYANSPPPAFVFAYGGTYVGNGTVQSIALPGPCHFLFIRRVGTGAGCFWFGTSLGASSLGSRLPSPYIRVFSDSLGVVQFQVNGVSSDVNFNGATYQFIAFCDPENRFNLCGTYSHSPTSPSPNNNALINTLFTAEAVFLHRNELDSASGGDGVWYKGPGLSANNARALPSAAALTNAFTFSAGVLSTLTDAHQAVANMAYSLWKSTDGSSCSTVMIQLMTYTGNGVSPRNITLTPTSGRFPLFVIVQPNAATVGRFRDPSHAGINSGSLSSFADDGGGGIQGTGVDQITVGATLNSNGVAYSVFAICGDTAAMNNGLYYPEPCDTPPGGPRTPPDVLDGIFVIGSGGLVLNGSPSMLILKDITGIYTLVPGKKNDTLYDRQTGQPSVNRPILGSGKTGYIGG